MSNSASSAFCSTGSDSFSSEYARMFAAESKVTVCVQPFALPSDSKLAVTLVNASAGINRPANVEVQSLLQFFAGCDQRVFERTLKVHAIQPAGMGPRLSKNCAAWRSLLS